MKRLIKLAAIIIILPAMASAAQAYSPQVDYMAVMIQSAVTGDYSGGVRAQQSRDAKIDSLNLSYQKVAFDDLYQLSKIMYAEAGSSWLPDQWKMNVGEVVLNRVASPEFPDTIAQVLSQPGQYYGPNSAYFNRLLPDERCAKLALRLLEGERYLAPSVVFQANFRQGSGVYASYYDRYLGWTYFCISARPGLYAA